MAEEARVTALLGEVPTTPTAEARATALVGEVASAPAAMVYLTALVGEVAVLLPSASGRKYGPAVQ